MSGIPFSHDVDKFIQYLLENIKDTPIIDFQYIKTPSHVIEYSSRCLRSCDDIFTAMSHSDKIFSNKTKP